MLCYEGTQSIREVSEDLGRTENSVYQRLHRIRVRLLECIEQEDSREDVAMTQAELQDDPLREYAEQYCNGTLSAEQTAALERRLADDPRAMEFFVLYMEIHSQIAWEARARGEDSGEGRGTRNEENEEPADSVGAAVELPHQLTEQPHHVGIVPPIIIQPALSSSFPPFPFLVGSIGFSYLMATLIMGAALAIAHAWKLPDYPQVAKSSPAPAKAVVEPKVQFVGRITGMVGCRFEEGSGVENQKSKIRNQKCLVALGDKFALSSGLMEITYDTGAKVVLQGPVTYEVESPASGYLSIGKLTARVESTKSQVANLQISKSQISKFVVRTPSVTVTDLGTEFGVDVSQDGVSEVHVLKGLVRTQSCDETGGGSQPTELQEGEARQYQPASTLADHRELAQATMISFDRAKFESMRIPRREDRYQRWLAYSQKLREDPALVAYYTFESAGATNAILPNLSAAGGRWTGRSKTANGSTAACRASSR